MFKKTIYSEDIIFKRKPDIETIKTDEGIIISGTDLKDDSIYYLDNPVSCKIWDLIDGKNSLYEIKQVLLSEYSVSEKDLIKDLKDFLKNLYLKKLIIKTK